MRIVLDTNVVFSALLWQGTPYRLLNVIRHRDEARVVSSQALIDELAEVLTRPAAAKRLAVIGKTSREVLVDYIEVVEIVESREVPRSVIVGSFPLRSYERLLPPYIIGGLLALSLTRPRACI
ncbi:MAG: putative toxin-antitoxin system toxin component, PIN family [Nitrospira sp. LK70]|nr:putative toxin-antitoxin system toxin component, PIN family [Nitrospira sp. LK70]